MIHIQFQMTKKEYRTAYVQAMTIYYMKIYTITLLIGLSLITIIGQLTKSSTLNRSASTLLITFLPVLLLCMLVAVVIASFEVRKIFKNYPDIVEGNFKIKFEKNFMVMQINGSNKKFQYQPYRFYLGFSNSFILYQPQSASIAIPKNVVTTEQRKKIKAFVKAN